MSKEKQHGELSFNYNKQDAQPHVWSDAPSVLLYTEKSGAYQTYKHLPGVTQWKVTRQTESSRPRKKKEPHTIDVPIIHWVLDEAPITQKEHSVALPQSPEHTMVSALYSEMEGIKTLVVSIGNADNPQAWCDKACIEVAKYQQKERIEIFTSSEQVMVFRWKGALMPEDFLMKITEDRSKFVLSSLTLPPEPQQTKKRKAEEQLIESPAKRVKQEEKLENKDDLGYYADILNNLPRLLPPMPPQTWVETTTQQSSQPQTPQGNHRLATPSPGSAWTAWSATGTGSQRNR